MTQSPVLLPLEAESGAEMRGLWLAQGLVLYFLLVRVQGWSATETESKSSQIKELTRNYLIILRTERRAKNGAVGKTRTKEALTRGHFHVDIPMGTTAFRPPPAG